MTERHAPPVGRLRALSTFRAVVASSASAFLLLACGPATPPATTPPPGAPNVPAEIATAADEVVLMKVFAKGTQVYECHDTKWTLVGPDAELNDASGVHVGRHSTGPRWELDDGSKVAGEVVHKVDSKDGAAIPWVLLRAKDGSGGFAHVTSIQRVDTVGGKPPAASCTTEPKLQVPYTATYYFYARGG